MRKELLIIGLLVSSWVISASVAPDPFGLQELSAAVDAFPENAGQAFPFDLTGVQDGHMLLWSDANSRYEARPNELPDTAVGGTFTGILDQTIPNAPTPITFDTVENTRNLTLEADSFTFTVGADDSKIIIHPQPQITNLNNAGDDHRFEMWVQVDVGAGWVNVPNSGIAVDASPESTGVSGLAWVETSLSTGDKFRIMAASDHPTEVILDAQSSTVGGAFVPKIICSIQ